VAGERNERSYFEAVTSTPVDAAAVARISAIRDPVRRNLWITQAYADFAGRLHDLVDRRDHTWCSFAVWASATAGQSIRRQELPGIALQVLNDSARHRAKLNETNHRMRWWRMLFAAPLLLSEDVLAALDDAIGEVSKRIGHGNKLVFDELAPLFVAFLDAAEAGRISSDDDVDEVLAATGLEVSDDVQLAFRWYGRAVRPGDPVARARRVLAGNVLAVAHEQQRLQSDITASMDAGPASIGRLLYNTRTRKHHKGHRWLRFGPLRRAAAHVANDAWDELITELMMTLRVPGATLRLDHDVPPGQDGTTFPADLHDLAAPADPSEPAVVYGRWDRTHGTGKHDASGDWEQLASRMNFIVNLFRSRQQDVTLAVAPFTAEQLAAMEAGKIPDPPLLPQGSPHPPA
jgi:hypothetical protein